MIIIIIIIIINIVLMIINIIIIKIRISIIITIMPSYSERNIALSSQQSAISSGTHTYIEIFSPEHPNKHLTRVLELSVFQKNTKICTSNNTIRPNV